MRLWRLFLLTLDIMIVFFDEFRGNLVDEAAALFERSGAKTFERRMDYLLFKILDGLCWLHQSNSKHKFFQFYLDSFISRDVDNQSL